MYFMNTHDISREYWNSPTHILYNKDDLYNTQRTTIYYICVATLVRELCEFRDCNSQTSFTTIWQ